MLRVSIMKRQLSGILAIAFLLLPFTLIAQDETPASTAPAADTAATEDETTGQTTEDADSNSVVASDEADQSVGSGEDSAADKHWILTPYQIRIWLAVDASPQLQALDASAVSRRVNALVDNWVGAGWDLQMEAPPRKIYTDLLYNFDDLGILDIAALYEPLPEKKEAKIRAVQYDKRVFRRGGGG